MSRDNLSDHKMEYNLLNAKLCRLVQANPCMYDRSAANYLKKDHVERAWAKIAREVNDTENSKTNQQDPCLLESTELINLIETVNPPKITTVETPRTSSDKMREYIQKQREKETRRLLVDEIRVYLIPVLSCKERWRNVRTAYARSVNIYKSPCGPNKNKRYYLHDELQFLNKHIAPGLPSIRTEDMHENSRQSIDVKDNGCTFQITLDSSSPSPPPVEEQNQEVDDYEPSSGSESEPEQEPEKEPEPQPERERSEIGEPPTQITKKRRLNNSGELPKEIAIKSPKRDADSNFLQSLLPEMKNMNSRQKILFKGKIYQVLEEVFSDAKDFPRKDDSFISQSTCVPPNQAVPSGRSLSRPFFGNKIFAAERRDKVSEGPPKTNTAPIMVQLAQPHSENIIIKQENENVEVFVED